MTANPELLDPGAGAASGGRPRSDRPRPRDHSSARRDGCVRHRPRHAGRRRGQSDHDGLTDAFEKASGTDPLSADSDHDGLTDGFEVSGSHTDPLNADSDHDGLTDAVWSG